MKDGLGDVKIRLEESSGLVAIEKAIKSLTFTKSGDEMVRFSIQTGNGTGVAHFRGWRCFLVWPF